jgi:hypothetical protein
MDLIVWALLAFVLFGAIGMLIGQGKGRPAAGLFFGMLLGPFGWLVVLLGPSAQQMSSAPCPHCRGVLPFNQAQCNHCGNRVSWIKGRAFKPSRAA